MIKSIENAGTSEAGVGAALALEGAAPIEVAAGAIYAVAGTDGTEIIDTDAYAEHPRWGQYSRTVRDARSFVAYMAKHANQASEIWVDSESAEVVGIVDAPAGNRKDEGWERHVIRLKLRTTKAWDAWAAFDRQLQMQVAFADFIEEHAADVEEPPSARLLEIAQTFQAKTNVDFESGTRLDSGQTRLEYKETVTAKAGQRGNLDIPSEITLVLRPYVDGPAYRVPARLRYRLRGSALSLGIVIDRPQEILDGAFEDVVTAIREGRHDVPGMPDYEGLTQNIYRGRP
ncbi:YfdQ family protein [Gryllotalpicola protaetiae]|uniref:DUF2303 family protein n=1 Tax=Gryllotalpicola protaetiae TaxID=2419771 RepID=A0A387BEK1_9MICO|nr:DUF2303 family protein [Gryllotalpicola protaetiae]AYG02395.1 DUF2303 family protein [Gryllotalpicola protaetiae]